MQVVDMKEMNNNWIPVDICH